MATETRLGHVSIKHYLGSDTVDDVIIDGVFHIIKR